jgi:hypothetical protein
MKILHSADYSDEYRIPRGVKNGFFDYLRKKDSSPNFPRPLEEG